MFVTALILGILGSFHCVGMCGPIAFLLSLDRTNSVKKYSQLFLYHFGRLFTYSILGLLFGMLGKGLNLFGFQQKLSIAIGIIMILVIVIPQKHVKRFSISKPIYLAISKVKSALGSQLKKRTPDTFLTIGFLNGFLPCGLVYIAVFGAIASGSLVDGSLYMLGFGLGTIPLMTTAVYLGNFLKGELRQKIRKAIPVFVVIVGCFFVLRGMGLGIPYVSPTPVTEMVDANYNCHSVSVNK